MPDISHSASHLTKAHWPHVQFAKAAFPASLPALELPALGMGSWSMGDNPATRQEEIASLRYGLEAGLSVIDTAEMYGHGRSERIVGEAIHGQRDKAFIVSKVLPSHADYTNLLAACDRSLRHLGTEWIDLYLLHWRSATPLEETLKAFDTLIKQGKIRAWGVSNFDVDDMDELESLPSLRRHMITPPASNQILYSLEHRGVEFDLLARDRHANIVTMAYSPIGQGGKLLHHPVFQQIASHHETSHGRVSAAQVALAWVLRQQNILAIPKAATLSHQKENIAALELTLTHEDLSALDRAFPPPTRKMSLAVI